MKIIPHARAACKARERCVRGPGDHSTRSGPSTLTVDERAELVDAGWVPASDPADVHRDDWRDPSSAQDYPAWRALEIARRDAARDPRRA